MSGVMAQMMTAMAAKGMPTGPVICTVPLRIAVLWLSRYRIAAILGLTQLCFAKIVCDPTVLICSTCMQKLIFKIIRRKVQQCGVIGPTRKIVRGTLHSLHLESEFANARSTSGQQAAGRNFRVHEL
eukprot:s554_g7.t1